MLDSDWSSQNLLHSDWLLPEVATITTLLCTNYIYIYIYIYMLTYIYICMLTSQTFVNIFEAGRQILPDFLRE